MSSGAGTRPAASPTSPRCSISMTCRASTPRPSHARPTHSDTWFRSAEGPRPSNSPTPSMRSAIHAAITLDELMAAAPSLEWLHDMAKRKVTAHRLEESAATSRPAIPLPTTALWRINKRRQTIYVHLSVPPDQRMDLRNRAPRQAQREEELEPRHGPGRTSAHRRQSGQSVKKSLTSLTPLTEFWFSSLETTDITDARQRSQWAYRS